MIVTFKNDPLHRRLKIVPRRPWDKNCFNCALDVDADEPNSLCKIQGAHRSTSCHMHDIVYKEVKDTSK